MMQTANFYVGRLVVDINCKKMECFQRNARRLLRSSTQRHCAQMRRAHVYTGRDFAKNVRLDLHENGNDQNRLFWYIPLRADNFGKVATF